MPSPDGFNPFRDDIAQPLLILMGIVGLILMLACVNLSGLLLARAAARQREISIRLAIGAGRGRLVRQFLTESLVLAVDRRRRRPRARGLVQRQAVRRSSSTAASSSCRSRPTGACSRSRRWSSLVACVVAGLAPALQAVRVNVNPALKEVRAQGHGRLGKALVVAQLAISMVLIVGATLFVGTLVKLYAVDRGFDSDGVLVAERQEQPAVSRRARARRAERAARAAEALPGVRSASAAQVLPVGGSLWDRSVQVEGYAFRPDESENGRLQRRSRPTYFATLGTPLLSGREFDDRDTDTAPKVAIVNESFARYFFGDGSALGRRVTSVDVTYEIVGVVRDAKYQNLRDGRHQDDVHPVDAAGRGAAVELQLSGARGRRRPACASCPASIALVREADPALRVTDGAARTRRLIDRSIPTERIMATLGGLFGVLALRGRRRSACSASWRSRSRGARTSLACAWRSAPAAGR